MPVTSHFPYASILDLSALPEQSKKEIQETVEYIDYGFYPWYGYCGKITKVQMEA